MRNVSCGRRDGLRVVLQDRADQVGLTVGTEGRLARQHFVGERAERKDIGPGVGRFALKLLRCHVRHGAHDAAFHREILRAGQGGIESRAVAGRTPGGEAEVEHFGARPS